MTMTEAFTSKALQRSVTRLQDLSSCVSGSLCSSNMGAEQRPGLGMSVLQSVCTEPELLARQEPGLSSTGQAGSLRKLNTGPLSSFLISLVLAFWSLSNKILKSRHRPGTILRCFRTWRCPYLWNKSTYYCVEGCWGGSPKAFGHGS